MATINTYSMIEVSDEALRNAAGEGMDEFIKVFTDKYLEATGGNLTAETMPLLTGEQHSLLAYQLFRDEIMVGGFCQLIQNGYGSYIFDNPFAKAMRLWGAHDFSKLIYKAKKYMMPAVRILKKNARKRNLWLCTKTMRFSMTWKRNSSRWKRNLLRLSLLM